MSRKPYALQTGSYEWINYWFGGSAFESFDSLRRYVHGFQETSRSKKGVLVFLQVGASSRQQIASAKNACFNLPFSGALSRLEKNPTLGGPDIFVPGCGSAKRRAMPGHESNWIADHIDQFHPCAMDFDASTRLNLIRLDAHDEN